MKKLSDYRWTTDRKTAIEYKLIELNADGEPWEPGEGVHHKAWKVDPQTRRRLHSKPFLIDAVRISPLSLSV